MVKVKAVLINKFDSKIVNDWGKGDGSGFVVSQTWCVGALVISKWCQFAVEVFVGKNTHLR